jgi:PAS domain S-box-containing protein
MSENQTTSHTTSHTSALRIALIYVVAASLWIIVFHYLSVVVGGDVQMLALLQAWNGWLFVGLTAIALYFLIDRALAHQAVLLHSAAVATQALAAEDKRFRELFESSPVAMWIYDRKTLGFLAVNNRAVSRYGYSRSEFLSMTIKDIRPEDEVVALLKRLREQPDTGDDQLGCRHLLKDGSLIEVDIVSHPLEFCGRQARFVVAYDLTEQRRATEALRIAAVVFEQSSEAIVLADPDRHIVMVNEAFCKITGYSKEEAVGKPTNLLSSGRQDAEFFRRMWESLNGEGRWSGRIWNRRKNGEIYLEWLSITSVRDEQGVVTYYIAIFSELPEDAA